ncbi:STAS domain-containing protein [Streptomyces sp. NPDC048514]|uniref:STAS domain-containing protein n=1 Tax=Streptomyces sp. NPDC048514 TaxID=3365564 RepID=UPI0037102193
MRAEDLLQTHSVRCDRAVLLRVSGELDILSAPLLDDAVASCLDAQVETFCLDLGRLRFCDSTGHQALQRLCSGVAATHAVLHLIALHPHLRRVLPYLHDTAPTSWVPLPHTSTAGTAAAHGCPARLRFRRGGRAVDAGLGPRLRGPGPPVKERGVSRCDGCGQPPA